ncbi:MAG: DUF4440 domain-containing protein [Hoeflea sp.]|uniref:YybH family protein n=1 Tax=Hoeflea sp. TaxID=1940281 RepID=UPI001D339A8E|nr:nuclear transport factor 2 family protein [Hoeflea sp.]MBU4528378.1 DUF4440 domain-containing protein [Alphaproteobacteria bacterium]MBU4543047.1 DUF4440 domain-containing protein [Alphaproteobacteria bacterium]MBU4551738.1 DUF4440 domain-containing protein [Alphaproteobacteria bacterium]MBV1723633.1 DUF4440 domain-containing protein [Hoeflea sp.]MBV1761949.1 DUF4440 domain-containing protein [Hoeflea sp.]
MKLKLTGVTAMMVLAGLSTAQAQTETSPMETAAILATIETMTDAFAAGDVDTILSTYETGATVVAEPGMPVSGAAALREMFAQFIAQGVSFTYGAHDVVMAGDLALHLMKWTAPTPEGDVTALSVAVLRKQADGSWKMVIDQPFGDAVMHDDSVR